MLLQPRREVGVHGRLHHRAHGGVPEFRLRLPLELRLPELHGDDGDETLSDVLADEVLLLLLDESLAARVAVDHVGERLLQAFLVHAALVGVDRVRERVERLLVAVVPLERDLDLGALVLGLEMDHAIERVLAEGEVLHEVREAARGLEDLLRLLPLTLVDQLPIPERGDGYGDEVWTRLRWKLGSNRRRSVYGWMSIAAALVVAFIGGILWHARTQQTARPQVVAARNMPAPAAQPAS